MNSDIAISVKDITKIYKLYDSPQDRLKESINPFGKKYHRDFYALNGISFDIRKGETVGIVGKNGCGKSTLLKTITGVLTPNSGSVSVVGKISALLELGAGFNPQLTGLENVYFNGTIMGYTRDEMESKVDNILSFADIGHFVHQPVKTYSSGMFVRLAFAVAINVSPDILIVDEALSVGDEAFQRKCFSRIIDFKEMGKTILFVSHSAGTVVELCDRAMLFDRGELLLCGAPKPIVTRYQKLLYASEDKQETMRAEIKSLQATVPETSGALAEQPPEETGHHKTEINRPYYDPHLLPQSTVSYQSRGATIRDAHITTVAGEKVNILVRGQQYVYNYYVDFSEDAENVHFGMLIKTVMGVELGGLVSHPRVRPVPFIPRNTSKKQSFLFRCALTSGTYFLNAGVYGHVAGHETYLHRLIDAVMFKVQPENDVLSSGIVDFS
ncbi:MAG TPA: ABC transporter ATP-binding protein [Geomonas sp.]|nr:ABC transporter ATP-binding protein [Geomonas sp.]